MQLKIQRSQRAGGVLGNTAFFCLDVRADYSPEERSNIQKYKLGGEIIYASHRAQKHIEHAGAHLDRAQSGTAGERAAGLARGVLSIALAKMNLSISIASLGKGHHIECKNLEELLEAEETVRTACKGVTRYFEAAASFDGSELVIEYVNGEEKIHIRQEAVPLLEYAPASSEAPQSFAPLPPDPWAEMGKDFKRLYGMLESRWLALEQKSLTFAKSKGWNLTELQVRAVFGVAGLFAFILFLQIL